jgi:hypothetical protein
MKIYTNNTDAKEKPNQIQKRKFTELEPVTLFANSVLFFKKTV